MISVLDEAIGNLTSTLDRLGYLEDTLIVFTSDVINSHFYEGKNQL